ncbi:putative DNA polymerase subunit alpha [Burkholderia contaminans]|uniref:Putative DNA polymerase subunit alpha n=1 Tax=Burkholderia contaminans TaxID=488447 RepID=A0A6P3CCD4_9BURK|nr:putative DNA polymerase subunit alpha [Burkholderia contaminans]
MTLRSSTASPKVHHCFDSRADLLQRFAEAGLDPEAPLNQQWAAFAVQLPGYSQANALRMLADGNRRDARWLAAAAAPNWELLRDTVRDDTAPAP